MKEDKMTIVSWNCNGGFWEKFDAISKLEADIYVICECGNPAKSESAEYKEFAKNYLWIGENKDRGLGIFAKDENIQLELIPHKNELAEDYLVVKNEKGEKIGKRANENKKEIPKEEYIEFRHFLPVKVENSFNLLAVWAMGEDRKGGNRYVEMIHDFLDANKDNEELFGDTLIMCGDFNSSAVFNSKHTYKRTHRDIYGNPKNHTCLDCKLNRKGLVSVYHELTKEKSGEEKQLTFFQARHLNNPYHLDYVYASKELVEGKTTFTKNGEKVNDLDNEFEILDNWEWISLSDHLPIIFNFVEENLEKWKKERVNANVESNIKDECKEFVFSSDLNVDKEPPVK